MLIIFYKNKNMGTTYSNLRRRKSKIYHKKIENEGKKSKGNNTKRKITARNTSKIMNCFKNENYNIDDILESKADKKEFGQKYEEPINKAYNQNNKKLKSLSVQNLVKIKGGNNFSENNNNNQDDIYPESLDTNSSSSQINEEIDNKLLLDEQYNEKNDNSIDEEEEYDKNKNKENQIIITKNIKTVFIDTKLKGKNQNIKDDTKIIKTEDVNSTYLNSRTSSTSTTFDYEFNFYRNGNEIREGYISKLISKNIWNPNMKPKQHNSIIIFDWDDTLLPTSFLNPNGFFNEDMELSNEEQEKLLKLEKSVFLLLTEAIEKGNVCVITNAGKGWVKYSAKKFYPSIIELLSKIEIISARGEYEKIYPGNSREWKIQAFLNLLNFVNIKLVTNIICLGDSLFEIEAGRILASKFKEAFIKTIKFKEAPKLDELIKQLDLVSHQFSFIYSSIKNLTIRVEKIKKERI